MTVSAVQFYIWDISSSLFCVVHTGDLAGEYNHIVCFNPFMHSVPYMGRLLYHTQMEFFYIKGHFRVSVL